MFSVDFYKNLCSYNNIYFGALKSYEKMRQWWEKSNAVKTKFGARIFRISDLLELFPLSFTLKFGREFVWVRVYTCVCMCDQSVSQSVSQSVNKSVRKPLSKLVIHKLRHAEKRGKNSLNHKFDCKKVFPSSCTLFCIAFSVFFLLLKAFLLKLSTKNFLYVTSRFFGPTPKPPYFSVSQHHSISEPPFSSPAWRV